MGGAMDLVTGARRVIIAMTHTAKGTPKIVETLSLPLTSERRVDLIVTELAVIRPTDQGLLLMELAPGVSIEQVQAATGTQLIVPPDVPTMKLADL
jgi:acetate CoA/acetoacetate CoA-transferase beta subunit